MKTIHFTGVPIAVWGLRTLAHPSARAPRRFQFHRYRVRPAWPAHLADSAGAIFLRSTTGYDSPRS